MFIDFFQLDLPIAERLGSSEIACSWGDTSAVSIFENEIGSLVAMLPVPVEFSEKEILSHVYMAQEEGILILESDYLSIVETRFKVKVSNRILYPVRKKGVVARAVASLFFKLTA